MGINVGYYTLYIKSYMAWVDKEQYLNINAYLGLVSNIQIRIYGQSHLFTFSYYHFRLNTVITAPPLITGHPNGPDNGLCPTWIHVVITYKSPAELWGRAGPPHSPPLAVSLPGPCRTSERPCSFSHLCKSGSICHCVLSSWRGTAVHLKESIQRRYNVYYNIQWVFK